MDQVETVTLEAGTVLHYKGMPLELREATQVNMLHANKRLAEEMPETCETRADGGPCTETTPELRPGFAGESRARQPHSPT
jgi:hypothetical protein